MLIIPAIDLIDGQCVRLAQGKRQDRRVYSDNPVDVAKQWEDAGARLLHLVNLDGAFGQANTNAEQILRIRQSVDMMLELGGGVRTLQDAEGWLRQVGIERIIFGTAAVRHPETVGETIQTFGSERVVVGIDARGEQVTVQGWEEDTDVQMLDLAAAMKQLGVERLIYTDVSRDGMLSGPNVAATHRLAERSGLKVIASGGFALRDHFVDLCGHQSCNIEGAIVGKALYEGLLDLRELIAAFQNGY